MAAARVLLSIPVLVSASVADDTLLVVDRRAILSAYGALTLAVSDQAAFRRDAIVTRLTWRLGSTICHPERVVELHVGATATKATKAAAKAPAHGS
jgi:hypothetical protein